MLHKLFSSLLETKEHKKYDEQFHQMDKQEHPEDKIWGDLSLLIKLLFVLVASCSVGWIIFFLLLISQHQK